MKADALFLDVDGTLWDSTPLVANAWNRALSELNYTRRVDAAELKTLFGRPMNEIAEAVLGGTEPSGWGEVIRRCMAYEEDILAQNTEDISFVGVAQTVRALSARLPVCIVSNCQVGYIDLVLQKLGIADCITDQECFGATGKGKADNIRLVAERNGCRAPVYVGDIQRDSDAAHAAGIPFIHAAYGFGTATDADAVIKSFGELSALLEL